MIVLVVPQLTSAQSTVVSDSAQRALLLQLIESLQQQIVLLQAQLQKMQASPVRQVVVIGEEGVLSKSVDMVATYRVNGLADVTSITDPEHRAYFERVFALFPDEYDARIGRVAVFDAESAETFDAFVETLPPLHEQWLYAVNEEFVADVETSWGTELIIHELAHLVSYETVSGAVPAKSTCHAYFEQHGCPVRNSYLGEFVSDFWSTIDLNRAKRFADLDDEYESAYAYYEDHETDFVSDYAAIGPEEDFSEAFVYFMLDKVPTGRVAKQKVAFFASYSELVEMREEIQAAL